MTNEEKYKKAFEVIKSLYNKTKLLSSGEAREITLTLEENFPELKENDDERIRKWLIDYLWKEKIFLQEAHSFVENNPKYRCVMDAIAWLEKQGEKTEPIEGFNTEFERQISHLIASTINKEHEYNQGYVKWTANALLEYAKHELEKQGEQKPTEEITSNPDYVSPKDKALFKIATILSKHEDKDGSPLEEIRSILVDYGINN